VGDARAILPRLLDLLPAAACKESR